MKRTFTYFNLLTDEVYGYAFDVTHEEAQTFAKRINSTGIIQVYYMDGYYE